MSFMYTKARFVCTILQLAIKRHSIRLQTLHLYYGKRMDATLFILDFLPDIRDLYRVFVDFQCLQAIIFMGCFFYVCHPGNHIGAVC